MPDDDDTKVDNTAQSEDDLNADDDSDNHKIKQHIDTVKDTPEEEHQFEGEDASPNVKGEENVFSGDTPEGIPADIDAELEKVGLAGDSNGVKPLDVGDDIDY
jgi:hypothetical protein